MRKFIRVLKQLICKHQYEPSGSFDWSETTCAKCKLCWGVLGKYYG